MSVTYYMQKNKQVKVEIPNDLISDISNTRNLADRIVALFNICPEENGTWNEKEIAEIRNPGWAGSSGGRVARFKTEPQGNLKPVSSEKLVDAIIHSDDDLDVVFVVE